MGSDDFRMLASIKLSNAATCAADDAAAAAAGTDAGGCDDCGVDGGAAADADADVDDDDDDDDAVLSIFDVDLLH